MSSAQAPRPSAEAAQIVGGGGEMGKLIGARDWSKTPLGPIMR